MGAAVGKVGLEGALNEHSILLAVFYADWCAVCVRLLQSVLPKIEDEFSGDNDLFVAEVLVEHHNQELSNEDLVEEFNTRGEHPIVIVFYKGEEVCREKCWGNVRDQYKSVHKMLEKAVEKRRASKCLDEIQLVLPLTA